MTTSTNFNKILLQVLRAENKPLDIFKLVDKALKIKRIKKDRHRIGQEFYKLANKEDSPFLVDRLCENTPFLNFSSMV